jgi:hypothetical protein
MKDLKLTLFGEAATELSTTYAVVSGLVKSLGIEPKPVPYNGNAKGLDRKDMAQLRRALGQGRRRSKAPASVQAR